MSNEHIQKQQIDMSPAGRRLTETTDDIFRVGIVEFVTVWWRHRRAISGLIVVVIGDRPIRWRDRVPGGQAAGGRRVGLGRGRRRRLGGGDRLGVGEFVLLFPLHAPVLEPDLDLSLGETEHVSDLDAPSSRQIAVEVEFFL